MIQLSSAAWATKFDKIGMILSQCDFFSMCAEVTHMYFFPKMAVMHLCQLLSQSAKQIYLGGTPPIMPLWRIWWHATEIHPF